MASLKRLTETIWKDIRNEIQAQRGKEEHTAFIHWYFDICHGGTGQGVTITDGSGDGGIDAIYTVGKRVFVYQFKYTKNPFTGTVDKAELDRFERLFDAFHDADEHALNNALGNARRDVRDRLHDIMNEHHAKNVEAEFIFVSNRAVRLHSYSFGLIDGDELARRWQINRLFFSPPHPSIELKYEKSSKATLGSGPVKSWSFIIDAKQFQRYAETIETMLTVNVRLGKNNTITIDIAKTARDDGENFYLFNNGMYMVCRSVKFNDESGTMTIEEPGIINGGQTIRSIIRSKPAGPVKVLLRLVQLDIATELQLARSIIKRTNSQTPIPYDQTLVHDPAQIRIAQFFRNHGVFYERRKGDFTKNRQSIPQDTKIEMRALMQWWLALEHPRKIGQIRSSFRTILRESEEGLTRFVERDGCEKLFKRAALGYVIDRSCTSSFDDSRHKSAAKPLSLVLLVLTEEEFGRTLTSTMKKSTLILTDLKARRDIVDVLRPFVVFVIERSIVAANIARKDLQNMVKNDDDCVRILDSIRTHRKFKDLVSRTRTELARVM